MSTYSRELIIGDLDEVFSLFADHTNSEMLYQEINLFRDQLLVNDLASHSPKLTGNDDDESLLTQLMCFLVTVPSHFEDIIYPLLIAEKENLAPIVNKLLRLLFDGGFTIKFLHLLHGLDNHSTASTVLFQNELLSLVNHERSDIFMLASDLLYAAGLNAERTVPEKDLPIIYTLALSPETGLIDPSQNSLEHISGEGYLKETNDPLIYTQIVGFERKALAMQTGFKEYNIAYHIYAIGQDAQFPDWCANVSEQKLRDLYESVLDLKIPYSRPRIQKVYDGLAKVAMELYDSGCLDLDDLPELVPHFDPGLYRIQSVEMPITIRSILTSTGSAPSIDREWEHEIDEPNVSTALPSFDGEHYILAERTFLQGMGHGKAVETRKAFIDLQRMVSKNNFSKFLSTTQDLIRDYQDISQRGIVIYNNTPSVLPRANWLAINPLLAYELGLTLNKSQGNFRWDDASGKSVIESIFWQLGNTANRSSHHNSEAGFGWRVLVTRKGLEDIIVKLEGRSLSHYKRVARHLEFQQERHNTFIDEEDSKSIIERFTL